MRILVTAGNTQTPLDQVRCITNIFTGQTGTQIAREASHCGHDVVLLTSHPELIANNTLRRQAGELEVRPYRTLEDLHTLMASAICREPFDAVVHCAAVSDYQVTDNTPDNQRSFAL